MKNAILAAALVLSLTALGSTASIGADVARIDDHSLSNRAVLTSLWLAQVEMPLDADAAGALEELAYRARHVDLSDDSNAAHAGRMVASCTSPTTGCSLDATAVPDATSCITAQHVGKPGVVSVRITNAASGEHEDQVFSGHSHVEGHAAGAICVRSDTNSGHSVTIYGIGVFL